MLWHKGAKLFTIQSLVLTTPRKKPFKKIVGKGKDAGNQHFPISHIFYPFQSKFQFLSHILSSANASNFNQAKIMSICKELTLSHTIPTFNPEKKSLLKTLREKEKMLVTTIFYFPHIFYPSKNKFQFFRNIYFVVCKCF